MNAKYSEFFFQTSYFIYIASLLLYVTVIFSGKPFSIKWAPRALITGFAITTIGLLLRWLEAGAVEVEAFEKAEGTTITGFKWFTVFSGHPPFTNLYESLVFFAWGLVGIYLYLERRYKFQLAGFLVSALTLLTLGLASLSPGREIEPLVPALQSWWLHFHVFTAAIAYPAFMISAIIAFFYLLKSDLKTVLIGKWVSLSLFLSALMLSRGGRYLTGYDIRYMLTDPNSEELSPARYVVNLSATGGDLSEFDINFASTSMGIFLALALVACLAAAVLYFLAKSDDMSPFKKFGDIGLATGFLGFGLSALSYLFAVVSVKNVVFDEETLGGYILKDLTHRFGKTSAEQISSLSAPVGQTMELSIRSNPYAFMFVLACALLALGFVLASVKRNKFILKLPDLKSLDNISYRSILLGFPMMSLVIVTGMVWAHYSWGRYWGWDPKETWALITWIWYALYLHTRITVGWAGKRSAIIAVIGLGVVIFTYLGVNLGLTGDGLHTYGKG